MRGDIMTDKNIQIIEEFILNNQTDLYRFAFSYVKNKHDALDLVQDSIVDAINNHQQLKDPQKIKSWLMTIVRNNCLTLLNNSQREINYGDIPEKNIRVEDQNSVERIHLYRVIEQLDTEGKELIIMRYFEDLKLKDMASVLDLNLSTLKSRLYKALETLESKYKGEVFNG
jgi:RNA polymerase sigma-70 factor (ECF subfamily)